MSVDELQRIALKLANQCPTRYWLMIGYPQTPLKMAIGVCDYGDVGRLGIEMKQKGFTQTSLAEAFRMGVERAWLIERDDPPASPTPDAPPPAGTTKVEGR